MVTKKPKAQLSSSTQLKTVQGVRHSVQPVQMTTAQIMQRASLPPQSTLSQPMEVTCCGLTNIRVFTSRLPLFDYQDTGQYGPSADGCVGTTQFILGSKGRIRSFSKATMEADGVLNISHDRFFSTISNGGFTADPNILFDAPTNRWFLFCDGNTNLLLAYSDGTNNGTITATTVWNFVTVDTVTSSGFDFSSDPLLLPAFFDYTTLGVDNTSVLCAADVLNTDPDFFSSAAYAINKDSLGTNSVEIIAFRNLVDEATFFGPASIQGAQNFDISPFSYFISINALDLIQGFSDINNQGKLLLSTVTYQDGSATLSTQIVPVGPYVAGIPTPILGTPAFHMVDGVTTLRPAAAHIRKGKLYTCTYVGVDNQGNSTRQTTITRNAVRFWAINPSTAVELFEGTIFAQSFSNDFSQRSYLTPSLMTNPLEQILVGSTTCGAFEFLNAAITQVIPPSGGQEVPSIQPTCLFTNSGSSYYATEDWEFSPFARWGDHTRTSPDPSDNSWWSSQLFCSSKDTWGAQLAHAAAAA